MSKQTTLLVSKAGRGFLESTQVNMTEEQAEEMEQTERNKRTEMIANGTLHCIKTQVNSYDYNHRRAPQFHSTQNGYN